MHVGHIRSTAIGDAIYRIGTDAQGFFGVLDTFVGAVHHRIFFLNEPVNGAFLERLVGFERE